MKHKRLISIICSLLIAMFVSWLISTCLVFKPAYELISIDDGWKVTINDDQFDNVKLSEFYKILDGEKLRHGDELTFLITLPSGQESVPFPALLFRSRYTTLECFIDDTEIFSYALDMYEKDKFIGKQHHFISLPMEYQGKEFTMKMTVGENDAFNTLSPIILGSQQDVESKLVNDHLAIIATGMFLFMFGIAFLCITMFYAPTTPEVLGLMVSSLFCANLAAWLMSYYNLMSLFIYTRFETQIEYFTMYLIVPYCYLMVYFIQKIEMKRLYITAGLISTGVTLLQYILHYIFNIHLRVTLPLYHIVAVFGFAVMSYFFIRNVRKRDISPSGMIQMAGLVAFAVAEIIHLVSYVLDGFHIPNSYTLAMIAIDSGCLIYVMCQLANYMLYVTQAYAQRKEYASLTHLAYADGLTNMPNRARADKILEDLNKGDNDYCIVSVDLNGLKTVNDKFGHPSGDRYIKDFSKVLVTAFEEKGFCARVGGDEFLVIIQEATENEVEEMIGRMNSALNVMNAIYSEYQRSVATGFAFRHECPEGSPSHEVYLLADQRMYEMKRKMHEELGIKNRL